MGLEVFQTGRRGGANSIVELSSAPLNHFSALGRAQHGTSRTRTESLEATFLLGYYSRLTPSPDNTRATVVNNCHIAKETSRSIQNAHPTSLEPRDWPPRLCYSSDERGHIEECRCPFTHSAQSLMTKVDSEPSSLFRCARLLWNHKLEA